MSFERLVIDLGDDKEETEIYVIERKENSVVGTIPNRFSYVFEDYEIKNSKKPIVNVGDVLVKDYVRLPCENVYESDEEWGKICLFPKSKYEFIF